MDNKLIGLALVFLVGGVGIGYFVSLNQIRTLQAQINSYATEYNTLTDQYSQLNTSYRTLLMEQTLLTTEYTELSSEHSQLSSAYSALFSEHLWLNASYTNLYAAYTLLEEQVEYEVYFCGDRTYYPTLMTDLQTAHDAVYVALYSLKYDPSDPDDWANDLIRELVTAKNRGVRVSVIIENTTYHDPMSDNLAAYHYLVANGVLVQLDNDDETDHMKFVVIDDTIVYVGSHNWSESSLYYNHETSVKIVRVSIAKVFTDYFETIAS